MDAIESSACARLAEAMTEFDQPQKAFDTVIGAICDLAGTASGGLWGVPRNFLAAPRLADVSYATATDGCREIHSYLPLYPAFNYMVTHWQDVSVFKPIDVIGWDAWTQSGFYQDYLRRYDRKDNIVGVMRGASGAPRWFYSTCHEGRNAIRPRSARILAEWTPRIARGLENLERWREKVGRIESLEQIAGNTRDALLVLRANGHTTPALMAVSAAAMRILALDLCPPEKNLEYQELLRLSACARRAEETAVTWRARDGKTYALHALNGTRAIEPSTLIFRLTQTAHAPLDRDDHDAAIRSGLTRREADIFVLLAKGLGNREIGRDLRISPNTARTHIENIFQKLRVSNRIEAVNRVRTGKRDAGP